MTHPEVPDSVTVSACGTCGKSSLSIDLNMKQLVEGGSYVIETPNDVRIEDEVIAMIHLLAQETGIKVYVFEQGTIREQALAEAEWYMAGFEAGTKTIEETS